MTFQSKIHVLLFLCQNFCVFSAHIFFSYELLISLKKQTLKTNHKKTNALIVNGPECSDDVNNNEEKSFATEPNGSLKKKYVLHLFSFLPTNNAMKATSVISPLTNGLLGLRRSCGVAFELLHVITFYTTISLFPF